jgi:hypothetical protein
MPKTTDLALTAQDQEYAFVGKRNNNSGQLGKQMTKHMPREEFRETLCDIYNLVKSEDIDEDQPSHELSGEKFLEMMMLEVKQAIDVGNTALFKKLVEYDHQGVLTNYSQSFRRILDGKYPFASPLESDLAKLFTNFKAEFLSKRDFLLSDEVPGRKHIQHHLLLHSNMDTIYSLFQTLMNVMVMYMSLQYKAVDNKPYYDSGNVITYAINEIRSFLNKCLAHRYADRFVANSFIHKPEAIKTYMIATRQNINVAEISRQVNKLLEETDRFTNHTGEVAVYELSTSLSYMDHFETVLKMLCFLNVVEEVHLKLCKSAQSDTDETMSLLNINEL